MGATAAPSPVLRYPVIPLSPLSDGSGSRQSENRPICHDMSHGQTTQKTVTVVGPFPNKIGQSIEVSRDIHVLVSSTE